MAEDRNSAIPAFLLRVRVDNDILERNLSYELYATKSYGWEQK